MDAYTLTDQELRDVLAEVALENEGVRMCDCCGCETRYAADEETSACDECGNPLMLISDINSRANAQAIISKAAEQGGDIDLLVGASIYIDIRFKGTDSDMAEHAAARTIQLPKIGECAYCAARYTDGSPVACPHHDSAWCYVCDRPKSDCACVENGGTY